MKSNFSPEQRLLVKNGWLRKTLKIVFLISSMLKIQKILLKKKNSIENVCNWNTEIEVKNHLEEFIVQ